jgi:hypothetical protein
MKKNKPLLTILMASLLFFVAVELHRTADATIRSSVKEPIYAIGDKDFSVALSKGKGVIKLGPMFLGLHPGAIAFKTPAAALAYMKKKEMNKEKLAVYCLSGDYELDVNQEGELHHINKSLMLMKSSNTNRSDHITGVFDFQRAEAWSAMALPFFGSAATYCGSVIPSETRDIAIVSLVSTTLKTL